MDEHVVELGDACVVFDCAETTEAQAISGEQHQQAAGLFYCIQPKQKKTTNSGRVTDSKNSEFIPQLHNRDAFSINGNTL